MENNTPIFVLGMPRCRTAWLSVALLSLGVDCTHEGMRDHAAFETYAAELQTRLRAGQAGDSDPALAYHIDRVFEQWPDARFLVVYREESESLAALLAAAPGFEQSLRQSWSGYLAAFHRACDRLRTRALFLPAHTLSEVETLLDAMTHLTGKRPSTDWARRIIRLKVTTTIDPASITALPALPRLEIPHCAGIDTTGLSAAAYTNLDFDTVAAWWAAHGEGTLVQAALPPLGVVVSHEGEPWAALWCYECYGVPVAELTFPVTRPGLPLADASRALMYAVLACLHTAGQGHLPRASFSTFKVSARLPFVRFLKRLGFTESLTERQPMLLTLCPRP